MVKHKYFFFDGYTQATHIHLHIYHQHEELKANFEFIKNYSHSLMKIIHYKITFHLGNMLSVYLLFYLSLVSLSFLRSWVWQWPKAKIHKLKKQNNKHIIFFFACITLFFILLRLLLLLS